MSKELEAYDIVFNSFNNCTCQDGRFPVRSALDTIYQALKRNEPMKVDLKTKYALPYSGTYYECPNCKKNTFQNKTYCPDCGQKLDWSDEK